MSVDVKDRTTATPLGGRKGTAKTRDGALDVKLSTPKGLGGAVGDGVNPEQLFATGYSACFLGAMKAVAPSLKHKVPNDARVTAAVGIGPCSEGGFGITADLVTRTRDPSDERRVIVALTPAGRALREDATRIPEAVTETFGLTSEAVASLRESVRALTDALARSLLGTEPDAKDGLRQPPP